jgi:hypothetical protein
MLASWPKWATGHQTLSPVTDTATLATADCRRGRAMGYQVAAKAVSDDGGTSASAGGISTYLP